ncbi:MAG: SdpI family protein [Oscillospiraceae bacterium]|nr:SdpI family protein [Oscillospiraceae bacterium]
MIKKNWKQLLLTSAVILLPVLAGLLLWDRLPATMNIHWGADGQPDGAAGKAFAVFAPSLCVLAVHWLCIIVTNKDMKSQPPKAMALTLWICPALSLCMHSIMYTIALGLEVNMGMLLFMPMGILFAVMGNYMPKFRRNSTMGIKTTWALADDENWNATHRFGGRMWVAGGLLVCVLSCLPWDWAVVLTFIVIFVFAFAPMIYSWQFYRKKKASGKEVPVYRSPYSKWTWVIIAVFLLFLAWVMFSGNIEYTFGENSLTIDADHWDAISVSYEDIEAIEYREDMVSGSREWGYGSARLLLGTFRNEEFGFYTRYTYGGKGSCIVLTVEDKVLVISDQDSEGTKALYDQLLEKIG